MIIVWRAWAVRRVPTGRHQLRPSIRWEVARTAGWFAEGQPGEWPPLDLLASVERVPETVETLVGMAHSPAAQAWEPGLSAARCVTFGHQPPNDHGPADAGDPGCGFYGMKPGWGLPVTSASATAGAPGGCQCRIPGLAGLSGEVTEAPRGYRASHGRVLALLVPPALATLRHHQPELSSWGGCTCPMHAGSSPDRVAVDDRDPDATETAESHVAGLADRYKVPVFRDQPALLDYAATLEQPVTWPVTDVPPALAGPEWVDRIVLRYGYASGGWISGPTV